MLILSVLVVVSTGVSGQKEFKKADKLMGLKAFDLAIKNYESALQKYPEKAEGYAKLGKAFHMTNQLLKSLSAYEKAFSVDDNLSSTYRMEYAQTLKKVGMYDKAEGQLRMVQSDMPVQAEHHLMSIAFAKTILQERDQFDVMTFDGNSKKSDFGAAFFDDKMVFCSFRQDMKRDTDKKNPSYINSEGNQLYVTTLNDGQLDVRFLRPDYKETRNIGPLSYSRDGRMVAFMRNSFSNGSNQIFSDDSDMSIYFALTSEDGDFTDAKPFPYNQIEYSYAFPNLGFNGSALYFSSNRPGGQGGFDIYVSYFKDGQWSNPENLGAEVNSPGNEITPFFDGEKLYFASDYHMGLGGYDNFISEVIDGQWAAAENMGKGVNSPSDDYYLTPNVNQGSYYFTSNRLGGLGKDDIYIAYLIEEQGPISIEVDIPPAINLEDLAVQNASDVPQDPVEDMVYDEEKEDPVAVSVSNAEVVGIVEMPKTESANVEVAMEEEMMLMDLSGAKLVSVTNSTKPMLDEFARLYFIQLASLSRSEGDASKFESVKSYGNLYRFFKQRSVKIRLGYYQSKEEADSKLAMVKKAGFRDAFVTSDILGSAEFEVLGSSDSGSLWIDEFHPTSAYKVKLASYLDPLKFRVENVLDLGRLEQWTKGKWTIFILGGFDSLDEAKRARISAMNRGFRDAELVEDDNGILKRVRDR